MKQKGITIMELLIVIVVMAIVAGFATITVTEIVHSARVKVDSMNLDTLNDVTYNYASYENISSGDIFSGYTTNEDRMIELVEAGALSKVIRPQQFGASFEWDIDLQVWSLVNGEYVGNTGVSSGFDFSNKTDQELSDLGVVSIDMNDWTTTDSGIENNTGESRIFVPISSNTYTITSSAALSEGTSGGYGVFFDTILENDNVNRDTGYVIQFDRGYGNGAIIVRPRTSGSEGSPVWQLRESQSNLIPSKYDDPEWWTSTHTIKVVVTNLDEVTRKAVFYLDGNVLGEYEYVNAIGGNQIYTGYRGWGSSPTVFYGLSIN